MKTHPSILAISLPAIAVWLHIITLPVAAQSAEGFDTSDLAPAAPAPATSVEAKAASNPSLAKVDIVASRYAGEEIAGYVNLLSSRLTIAKREVDPFGRFQDPDRKMPEPKIMNKTPNQRSFKAEPPTPFSDVVAMLSVKLVNTAKQQFLIGDRMFKVKDIFPIQLTSNGKKYRVQVLSVSHTRISFRNLDTGETGVLNLDITPAGMSRGTSGISVPGIQASGEDAPIEVQPSVPLSTNP